MTIISWIVNGSAFGLIGHAACLIIAIIALGYAIYLRWRNEAEQSGVFDSIYDGNDDY
jgi:hypothetical protein